MTPPEAQTISRSQHETTDNLASGEHERNVAEAAGERVFDMSVDPAVATLESRDPAIPVLEGRQIKQVAAVDKGRFSVAGFCISTEQRTRCQPAGERPATDRRVVGSHNVKRSLWQGAPDSASVQPYAVDRA